MIFFKAPTICIINTLFTLMGLVIVLGPCKSHKLSWDVWDSHSCGLHYSVFNVLYV